MRIDVIQFLAQHVQTGKDLCDVLSRDQQYATLVARREAALAAHAPSEVVEELLDLEDERLAQLGTSAFLASPLIYLHEYIDGAAQVQVIQVPPSIAACFGHTDLPDAPDLAFLVPPFDDFLVVVPAGGLPAHCGREIRVLHVHTEAACWNANLGRKSTTTVISAYTSDGYLPVGTLDDWSPDTLKTLDAAALAAAARLVLHLCLYLLTNEPRTVLSQPPPSTWAASRARKAGKAGKSLRRPVSVTRLGRPGCEPERAAESPSGVKRKGCWVRGHYWPRMSNVEAIAKYGLHLRKPHFRQGSDCELPKVRRYDLGDDE